MRFILTFIFLFLFYGCSTVEILRGPAAYQPTSIECSKMLSLFFKSHKNLEVKKVDKSTIEVLESFEVNHTYVHSFEGILEVGDGAIINIRHVDLNNWTLKDSKGREWQSRFNFTTHQLKLSKDHYSKEEDALFFDVAQITELSTKVILKVGEDHRIELTVPSTSNDIVNSFIEVIKVRISALPEEYIKNVKEVVISPSIYSRYKKAAATADSREITFYRLFFNNDIKTKDYELSDYVMVHEFGHIFAHLKYGTHTPDSLWEEAMELDKYSVSSYANTNLAEDFAETVRVYFEVEKNGLKDPKWKFYSHRFAELDRLFHNDPNLRYQLESVMKLKKKLPKITISLVLLSGAVVTQDIDE